MPFTVVVQLSELTLSVRVSEADSTAATVAMSGAAVFDDSAPASASVRVEADPKPPRTPELEVELPGATVSRLVPSALISERT